MYIKTCYVCMYVAPTPTVSFDPSSPIQGTVGSSETIECRVETGSGVNNVTISWTGPGGGSIISDSRVTISPTTSSSITYTSTLQFTYLMEGDNGTYTCDWMILQTSGSSSVILQPPISKIICFNSYVVKIYRMEGNFGGGNVGELICFEHLAKESLAN